MFQIPPRGYLEKHLNLVKQCILHNHPNTPAGVFRKNIETLVKAMYFVASSDGHLDKKESKLLIKTATVLDMTPAHVKGVLSELDQSKIN